jgi:hypothetical protein
MADHPYTEILRHLDTAIDALGGHEASTAIATVVRFSVLPSRLSDRLMAIVDELEVIRDMLAHHPATVARMRRDDDDQSELDHLEIKGTLLEIKGILPQNDPDA